MKISKKDLEKIIMEEVQKAMVEEGFMDSIKSFGKKLGIGLTDVEKAKKVLEKYALDARDPNLAMANFIRDYGTGDTSDLAASYEEEYEGFKGRALSAADRMKAGRAARMSVGPQSFRGGGMLEEALEKDSLDKRELVLLLNKVLENPPRAFYGFKLSNAHRELNDEMIGEFGEFDLEATPDSVDMKSDFDPSLPKLDSPRELAEPLRVALSALMSEPSFQKIMNPRELDAALQGKDLELLQKVHDKIIGADGAIKKEFLNVGKIVDELDFRKQFLRQARPFGGGKGVPRGRSGRLQDLATAGEYSITGRPVSAAE